MRKIDVFLVAISILLSVTSANAAVTCEGDVRTVKVGEYGAQESYLIIHLQDSNGVGFDYRLGRADDDYAKARMALANTALIASQKFRLKFWDRSDCATAAADRITPNSVQLVK